MKRHVLAVSERHHKIQNKGNAPFSIKMVNITPLKLQRDTKFLCADLKSLHHY